MFCNLSLPKQLFVNASSRAVVFMNTYQLVPGNKYFVCHFSSDFVFHKIIAIKLNRM